MRVVASFVGGWGHAEPLLPVADLARRLGHRVSFAGQAAVVGRLGDLGYTTDVVGPDTLATEPMPLAPVDRDAEREVMRDHFVARFGRFRSAALGDLLDRERPDLVVCDEVDVGAVVAAERRGVPCVTVNVIAAGMLTHPSVVGAAWDDLRHAEDLAPDPGASRVGGVLTLAPLPRSLRDPAAPAPATMQFVRPGILEGEPVPPPRPDAPHGRGLVYATLGTVFNLESGDLFERLAIAMDRVAASGDVDVVLTTGPQVDTAALERLAPRVRFAAFVPQRDVLPRATAVVCHGGSGTLVAALSLGVPVVTLPMGADQPDNADRCVALGAGLVLDPLTATPDELAAATTAALTSAPLRSAAAALAAEAAAQPPLDDVPELRALLTAH